MENQLMIGDFAILNSNPTGMMENITAFLGLSTFKFGVQQIFNTRQNRGVHFESSHVGERSCSGKVGGCIHPLNRENFHEESWAYTTLTPEIRQALRDFYNIPNSELQKLLVRFGHPQMTWAPKWEP